MGDLSPHFFKVELECRCGCGLMNIQRPLLERLEDARERAGIPFKINSGSRCATHNKNVGGKVDSAHLSGLAVDLATPTSQERYKILLALFAAGFKRIGIGKGFVHADVDPAKPQMVVFDY